MDDTPIAYRSQSLGHAESAISREGAYLQDVFGAYHGDQHLEQAVLPLLRQGGFILADNTLWDGHVVDSAYAKDQQTLGICRFNDATAQDQRVEKVILPMRDGLTLIRKL